jgi:simple sugar transport system permease protein
LLFGAAEALQLQLQTRGGGVPTQLVQMLPYVVTMVALAGVIGRARPPAALGRPLED